MNTAAGATAGEDRCDICQTVTTTYTVFVDMPGLTVPYYVCSKECEEEARERGANAWKEYYQEFGEEGKHEA